MPNARAINTPRAGFNTYWAINPTESGKGLQKKKQEYWESQGQNRKNEELKESLVDSVGTSFYYLLNARAKSSMESLIPIDSMIPPRAGAYNSLDTLQKSLEYENILS